MAARKTHATAPSESSDESPLPFLCPAGSTIAFARYGVEVDWQFRFGVAKWWKGSRQRSELDAFRKNCGKNGLAHGAY